jgi:hypothetical protein
MIDFYFQHQTRASYLLGYPLFRTVGYFIAAGKMPPADAQTYPRKMIGLSRNPAIATGRMPRAGECRTQRIGVSASRVNPCGYRSPKKAGARASVLKG